MNTTQLHTWEEFEQKIGELRAEYSNPASPLFFRGQGDSMWKLETTLERNEPDRTSFIDYYRLLCTTGPEVRAYANIDAPHYDEDVADTFRDPELVFKLNIFPYSLYCYMARLRHFGFPSPLLDWTRSPYVAAFFAFREIMAAETRAIYAYCEKPDGIKGGALGEPTIFTMGPYIDTHQRHFRQRCDYTVCGSYDKGLRCWVFDSHQKIFEKRHRDQDYLWKFELPSTERISILRILSDYNLNSFSLFGSEESLLETMWFREHILRKLARDKIQI
jgi:hypothetical protein